MSSPSKMEAVAIDGPAGSGKSTVSKLTAKKLGYLYIDTGAMYRALTLKVMTEGVDLSNEGKIIELSRTTDIKLEPSEEEGKLIRVLLDGKDVSDEIRTMEVTVNVKHVCKLPKVRENLVALQRSLAESAHGSVMEGRDISTVVLKDAKYKFYVDASFDERVRRRFCEMESKGTPVTREEVADDLRQRDDTDMNREVGALKKANDAILLDTTNLTIDEVVQKIVDMVTA